MSLAPTTTFKCGSTKFRPRRIRLDGQGPSVRTGPGGDPESLQCGRAHCGAHKVTERRVMPLPDAVGELPWFADRDRPGPLDAEASTKDCAGFRRGCEPSCGLPRSCPDSQAPPSSPEQVCRGGEHGAPPDAGREYLRTAHWDRQRTFALERAQICKPCARGDRLDVHQRSYARVGFDRPEDPIVLCRECHGDHHRALVLRAIRATEHEPLAVTVADVLERAG
jgi:hypothetical protein